MRSRRDILRLGAQGCAVGLLPGCDGVVSGLAHALADDLPERIVAPNSTTIDPHHHLLDRAAFGPWPGDLERVAAMGQDAWIDEQLAPWSIDDTACDLRTGFIDAPNLPTSLVLELAPAHIQSQMVTYTLLRATYSRRQLQEVMVGFWNDHFNIAINKAECSWLKPRDDREVIRAHALGNFRSLLEASVRSPAMLVYLDGRDNKVEAVGDRPNENHARELLELHAHGVRSGYTQHDVMEAARCLTGFIVREQWAPGVAQFDPARHDNGRKTVLGQTIPAGGGETDVTRLVDIVVAHPACAGFIAHKLCRFFVADPPPPDLVRRAARRFRATEGEIGEVVRLILSSDEFRLHAHHRGSKLKRPFRYMVSALRSLAADTHARGQLQQSLERLGHLPFQYPTPDGYPQEPGPWLGSLLWRWNFALALAQGTLDDTSIDARRLMARFQGEAEGDEPGARLAAHLFGRVPRAAERDALAQGTNDLDDAQRLALLLCSPRFQRH